MSESNNQLSGYFTKKNDQSAFKAIYLEFYPKLLVFSKGYVKQKEVAEDIVEDILIKLWDNRSLLTHINNLKFYLFVSAKNACLNYLAKNKRMHSAGLDCFEFEMGPIIVSPEDTVISEEKIEMIQNAIEALPLVRHKTKKTWR